jgi:hypothetical protein
MTMATGRPEWRRLDGYLAQRPKTGASFATPGRLRTGMREQ